MNSVRVNPGVQRAQMLLVKTATFKTGSEE